MNWKTAVDIGAILAPVQPGLQLVEAKMKTVESSLFTPLATAFVDLIGSGGKRLRPAVALMAARFNGELGRAQYEQVISLAASVEMLHTATLVHDDVIDGALLRRGAPTLNATWNRGATVLAGNYMFARAANFAAETGNPRVIRIFSDTLEIIVEGELRQLRARHQFRQQKDEYYQRIYAKTASLFAAAAEAAATLSGLEEDGIGSLRDYGHNLGMASRSSTTSSTSRATPAAGQTGGRRPAAGHVDPAFLLLSPDSASPSGTARPVGDAVQRRHEQRRRAVDATSGGGGAGFAQRARD